MAKKGRIESNNRKKLIVAAQQEKRNRLKERQKKIFHSYTALIASATTEDKKKELLQKASMELFQISVVFQKLRRDGSATRVRNRCAITGRSRGYYGLFGLSRNVIRETASFGLIMGLTKSSW
jgi:small subunit ribosomal protein S14